MADKHKPRGGLAAVFLTLLLAAACGVGLLIIALTAASYEQSLERTEDARFLRFASQLTGMDLAPDKLASANIINDDTENPNIEFGRAVALVGKDGTVLDSSIQFSSEYNAGRVFVNWRDGYAYIHFESYYGKAQKFRVSTFDETYLESDALKRGEIGTSLVSDEDTESERQRLDTGVSGRMLIHAISDAQGNQVFALELIQRKINDIWGLAGAAGPLPHRAALLREAWNLLWAAFLLLLALYWLGLAYWVYLDARRHAMPAKPWVIATLLGNLLGFAVYYRAARKKMRYEAVKTCPACGGRMLRAFPCCPWCGAPQGKRCPACGAAMHDGWAVCPHCDGTLKTAEPESQAPAATPVIVPVPFAVLMQPEAPEHEPEPEPVIPPIFMDGSPYR